MALKYIIDELVQVIGPHREFYKPTPDGKFALDIDGHPDAVRLAEFRSTNIAMMKRFEGVDPDEYKALKAKAAAGDADDVVALKLALATEQGKTAAAIADAATLARRHLVSAAFLAAGGQPSAVDLIVLKAPAEADKLDEWIKDAAISAELSYAFKPSSGGSAKGAKPVLGAVNPNVLRNPTSQDLGKFASEIKSGKLKVEYTT